MVMGEVVKDEVMEVLGGWGVERVNGKGKGMGGFRI